MIDAAEALRLFGPPELERSMVLFDVPAHLEVGAIPKRIYCNRYLVQPLQMALETLVYHDKADLIRTWDGCFNIRKKRGYESPSLHSWGLAIDINAAWNQLGKPPTQDPFLVQTFERAGFVWGGRWKRPDGMHFELGQVV